MRNRIVSLILAISLIVCLLPSTVFANGYGDNSATSSLSSEQLNSVVMLNYLTVLTQEINSSSNSLLYLEEAYSSLLDNTNSKAIDSETQYYLNNLLNVLESYRMIQVKRDRLEYIYEQNKARALREAVPNPLGLLSAVQSFSMKKIIASVVYMAVDSATSYQNASSEAEMAYLKDGWELDDAAQATLHNSKVQLFNYMLDISRKYQLPDELSFRAPDVEALVKQENNKNNASRIQFLEDSEETYQAFGGYWILLAKSYYEKGEYAKCLAAVKRYEDLRVGIFRKDYDYAEILPLAICALEETANENTYITEAGRYASLIEKNTSNEDWALRYFAAQTYVNLYAKTKDEAYLNKAYTLVRKNVNALVATQKQLNAEYLSDIVEVETPKDATKQEKKDIKQYNKMLKEIRKTELPPIYEPLKLNCDLLFALAGQIGITDSEKNKVDAILHQDGEALFLVKPIDNMYQFTAAAGAAPRVEFDGTELIIPIEMLSNASSIKLTVYDADSTVFEDWTLDEVKRKSGNPIETFTATYVSKAIKKYDYTKDSIVLVEIVPMASSECETISIQFKVDSYKKIAFITNISFSQVE